MEEVTIADYEKAKKDLEDLQAALKAKGLEFVDPNGKPLLKSKIFWANIIALAATVAQQAFGYALSPEQLALVLGIGLPVLNMFLRYLNPDISGLAK